MKKLPYLRHRGAALIVVLSIIVLVSGLVVGLAMAMRMERTASFYHLERTRADLFARQGVDYGEALISAATTNGRFWVSGPGRIYASPTNTIGMPSTFIDLSSGVTKDTNSTNSADINRLGLSGTDRLLDPTGTNLNVKWIYVKKSGPSVNYDTNASPTIDTNVVGRFAFWVDDESTRVDLSTADHRTTNSTDWASPQEIDLASLGGFSSYVTTVRQRSEKGPLNTPNELMGMSNLPPGLTNALITNRFNITHYTQDPEVDPWGKGRIVLTTRGDRAKQRDNFLNILVGTNNNPGKLSELGIPQVNTSLALIMNRLIQTNWPFVTDQEASWAKKYGTNSAGQLALDIVEYVRSAESSDAFVEPLTARLVGTNLAYDPTMRASTFPANGLIGTTRRPTISEMGVWVDGTPTNGAYPGKLFVEVYIPPGYGVGFTNLPPLFIASDLTANIPAPATPMATNGRFIRVEQDFTNTIRPANVNLRVALLKSMSDTAESILDIAPADASSTIAYTVDAPGVTTNQIKSWEVRDPRVNKYLVNWEPNASANTMFPPNPNTRWSSLFAPPSGMPPADTGSSGAMSEAGVQMAPTGIVGSVGELGYINTGVISNMPWRSVRLQPSGLNNTNALPDWALLELFSAPVANSTNVPGTNLVSGRVNLNSLILNSAETNMFRTNVLNTLLPNTFVLTNGNTALNAVVISNIINATNLAANGANFASATNNRIYQSVGQLAEMIGISDRGEESEKVMRQIASLATVRGNVFSIYSVGQALQVTKAGKVVVNGEKMVRAIVERTYTTGGVPQYKVIYWSEIYP